jgi:hypothetical protein
MLFFACALNASADRYAIGDYSQDVYMNEPASNFYDESAGLRFDNYKSYEKGDFTSYTWSGANMTRTEAGLLTDGTYTNIHCLLSRNLSAEALENPAHEMSEEILTNGSMFRYYESGMHSDYSEELRFAIPKNAVEYRINTGYIPMKRIEDSDGKYLDYEYRGKIIFLGEEYYVRDISGDTMYLDKAKVLDNVSSVGFYSEYNGYRFKVANLTYSDGIVTSILLYVQTPDGSIVQVTVSKLANGVVDNLEIFGIYGELSGSVQTASLIVYDLSSQVLLEDGEDLEIGGQVKTDWEVQFSIADTCEGDPECDISEYDDMDPYAMDTLLRSINIVYSHDLVGDEALAEDESLNFPNHFYLRFKGYKDDQFGEVSDSGAGEGNIQVRRGDAAYSLVLNFTGTDGQRYDGVRLDEGPFTMGTDFIFDGTMYYYSTYSQSTSIPRSADDKVNITLRPTMGGSDVFIANLQRYCDPEDGASLSDPTYTHKNCSDIGDIYIRELALSDALKDGYTLPVTASDYEKDKELTLNPNRIFIKKNALSIGSRTMDIVFDDGTNTVFFAEDFSTDKSIGVNQHMVGIFNQFQSSGYGLSMRVYNEGGLASDPNSQTYNVSSDLNKDGDDDDALIAFGVADGQVILDMSDRDYDAEIDTGYSNDLYLDSDSDAARDSGDYEISEDTDTLLIAPRGGDRFLLDWGAGNRIDSLDVHHPVEDVYSTYFLWTLEGEGTTTTTTTTTTSTTSSTSTTLSNCILPGDSPPCGVISLAEVISYINQWASGSASLSGVIDLINAWASGT